MKYLSDYTQERHSQLFKETGTFFAFSQDQFDKQKQEGVKYTSVSGGMFCPSENVPALVEGLNTIYKEAIQQDIEENGIEKIIVRELYNYECFYTYDISDATAALKDYGITEEQVKVHFHKEKVHADV